MGKIACPLSFQPTPLYASKVSAYPSEATGLISVWNALPWTNTFVQLSLNEADTIEQCILDANAGKQLS
jgi:hypothetical protein